MLRTGRRDAAGRSAVPRQPVRPDPMGFHTKPTAAALSGECLKLSIAMMLWLAMRDPSIQGGMSPRIRSEA